MTFLKKLILFFIVGALIGIPFKFFVNFTKSGDPFIFNDLEACLYCGKAGILIYIATVLYPDKEKEV